DSAIAASASLAGLQEYDTQYLEQRLSPLEQFIMELTDTFTITDRFVQNPAPLHNSLFDLYRRFNEDVTGLLQFNDPGSMYLHCMECSIL
ncbi:MAG: hypothetical protein WD601_10285, partial [Pseudohongiellaceae bacterium]